MRTPRAPGGAPGGDLSRPAIEPEVSLRLISFTFVAGARLIGDAHGSHGAALNTLLRRLVIGAAMAGILGTLWVLKAQTVTVIEMLAEHVHSAGASGVEP